MFESAPHRHRLSARDRQLLAQVDRYHLATLATLRQAVEPALSASAVTKVVRRLCTADWLRKVSLDHPRCYVVLGRRGLALLGRGPARAQPLGPQALPSAFAVLQYAVLSRPSRERLRPEELRAHWSWLSAPLSQAPHCRVPGESIIELVRVDLGGPAHHVARKCAHDLAERGRLRPFAAEVAARRFRLVVITASPEKGAALQQALDRHVWPSGLAIHLAVIPALLSVLPRKRHA